MTAPAAPERLPRTFGLKDVFTTINLMGGVVAVLFCFEGNIRYAAYAFLLGYIFGDALDGMVARATNTGNRFGAEFDAASDYMAHNIAPAFILFVAYRDTSYILAASLASILIITGTIRQARSAVVPWGFPKAYAGIPRTGSALILASYVNSLMFQEYAYAKWVGIGLVVVLSIGHLLPIPVRTHKGRKIQTFVKILIFGFFSTTLASLAFYRVIVFDVVWFWIQGYVIASWLALYPDERRAFFKRYKEWSMEVRKAK